MPMTEEQKNAALKIITNNLAILNYYAYDNLLIHHDEDNNTSIKSDSRVSVGFREPIKPPEIEPILRLYCERQGPRALSRSIIDYKTDIFSLCTERIKLPKSLWFFFKSSIWFYIAFFFKKISKKGVYSPENQLKIKSYLSKLSEHIIDKPAQVEINSIPPNSINTNKSQICISMMASLPQAVEKHINNAQELLISRIDLLESKLNTEKAILKDIPIEKSMIIPNKESIAHAQPAKNTQLSHAPAIDPYGNTIIPPGMLPLISQYIPKPEINQLNSSVMLIDDFELEQRGNIDIIPPQSQKVARITGKVKDLPRLGGTQINYKLPTLLTARNFKMLEVFDQKYLGIDNEYANMTVCQKEATNNIGIIFSTAATDYSLNLSGPAGPVNPLCSDIFKFIGQDPRFKDAITKHTK